MTTCPEGQFRVEMPDGVVVERLPVGHARGEWRFAFVFHGYDLSRRPGPMYDFTRELNDRIAIEAVDGELRRGDRGWGGGDKSHVYQMTHPSDGVSEIRLTYSHDSAVLATETVRPVARAPFRVEVLDGLLVERLPVGRANGAWHVGFVWSGTDPVVREDSAPFCDFEPTAEPLLAVTGVGRALEQVGAHSSGGGGEYERWWEYSDLGVDGLLVRYGPADAPVATETIDLGAAGAGG